MPDESHCFFAVTRIAVYAVFDGDDENWPGIEKIAVPFRNTPSDTERMSGGSCVAIAGEHGIVLYDPDPRHKTRDPNRQPKDSWGCHTGPVVGLFLDEEKALACFRKPDLQPNDQRFRDESLQVLAAIDDHHPVFVISELHYARNPVTA